MDKFSDPNAFDHHGFLRYFLAVENPDAYPSQLWLNPLTALFARLTESESQLLRSRLTIGEKLRPVDRREFMTLDAKIRSSADFVRLGDDLAAFESAYFCSFRDGRCDVCGGPQGIGGPLCGSRLGSPAPASPPAVSEIPQPTPESETKSSDPLLDFFKIPYEPGELNGFEYDALIDSAPVVVWRPPSELETDFVDDILAEAVSAGVQRVFLVARTEIGPEKLPMNPSVALILLAIPPTFSVPAMNVIETDEIVFS